MEAEKTSEEIIKSGGGEKSPHAVKALFISLFALVLSLASLGAGEELKIMAASNVIEANYQTITEFRILRQSLLQDTIEQMEISSWSNTSLSSDKKNELEKLIASKKKDIQLLESNADTQDGKKEVELKLSEVQQEKKLARLKHKSFEYGEALLQIAIILVSTSIISSIAGLVLGGIVVGSFGILAVLNGFFLFLTL
jgi:flagellar motor protein MotB